MLLRKSRVFGVLTGKSPLGGSAGEALLTRPVFLTRSSKELFPTPLYGGENRGSERHS